jgi:hypothetical protein
MSRFDWTTWQKKMIFKRTNISTDMVRFSMTNEAPLLSGLDHVYFIVSIVHLAYFQSLSSLLLLALGLFKILLHLTHIQQESILIIKNHGVQFEKLFYSGSKQFHFFDQDALSSVIINEGFRNQQVLYYVAFCLKNCNEMKLPFERIFPRLADVIDIWIACKTLF